MYEQKTKENDASVEKFLNAVADEKKRKDSFAIMKIMQDITKSKPKMWGGSIVGFGSYHYKYASGHEGDTCLIGFSPRKANISLYLMCGLHADKKLMDKLGKHKMGKGCLYINNLDDVNVDVLKKVIEVSAEAVTKHVDKMKKKGK